MGNTRKSTTTDEAYEKGRTRYLRNREHQLAEAKKRYQIDRESRLKKAKEINEAARRQRLALKTLALYKQHKHTCTRKNKKEYVQVFKEAYPCVDCATFYPYYVMDFDHVRGVKVAGVSQLTFARTSPTNLFIEIDKCDLVCANCHRIRSFKRKQHLSNK